MNNTTPSVPKLSGKLTLWAFRLPIWLFRFHLGWLLGQRFLMIEHTGRKSGLSRKTVLEVLRHDTSNDTYYIGSARGKKSNWFQNVSVNPEVAVHVGFRKFNTFAKQVPIEITELELLSYARRHPIAIRELNRLVGYQIEPTEEGLKSLAQLMPVLALRPYKVVNN